MKEYELWIDESGTFEAQEQQDTALNPSLVGGILVPKDTFTEAEITNLVNANALNGNNPQNENETPHVTTMNREQRKTVVLPALETIVNRGGKLVYFENQQRIIDFNDKELYLRLLATGLVQLFSRLGADGPFAIDITIAVRFSESEDNNEERHEIEENEYINTLKYYIQTGWKDKSFDIDTTCKINVSILSARIERRLQLADYACNSRITRTSGMFDEEGRQRLYALFDNNYIFSFNILSSENIIISALGTSNFSDAMMEFYTGRGDIDKTKIHRLIYKKLSESSYRIIRLNLRSFVNTLIANIQSGYNFIEDERILEDVIKDLKKSLKEYKIEVQTDELFMKLYLYLADRYLREGNIIKARTVFSDMDALIKTMNYKVENLAYLYMYNEKKALYEINCMNYQGAVTTMNMTISCLEDLISILDANESIKKFMGDAKDFKSEYLGDAYCMKTYAEMFLQRKNKVRYEDIKEDNKKALDQYKYEGELERNQQYRAHIEMEQGDYLEAIKWLFKTKNIDISSEETVDKKNVKKAALDYLNASAYEDSLSRAYYLMYYIEIMLAAFFNRDFKYLSDALYQALWEQKSIAEEFLSETPFATEIQSDSTRITPHVYEDLLGTTIGNKPRTYHPQEIILWKYGSYLAANSYNKAKDYFIRATKVCNENPDYTVLKIIAIAINMDKIAFLISQKVEEKEINEELKKQKKSIISLKELNISKEMKTFLTDAEAAVEKALDESNIIKKKTIIENISNEIAY